MIYVDPIRYCPGMGHLCRLWSDCPLPELVAFAQGIGCKGEKRYYALNTGARAKAVAAGAVEVTVARMDDMIGRSERTTKGGDPIEESGSKISTSQLLLARHDGRHRPGACPRGQAMRLEVRPGLQSIAEEFASWWVNRPTESRLDNPDLHERFDDLTLQEQNVCILHAALVQSLSQTAEGAASTWQKSETK